MLNRIEGKSIQEYLAPLNSNPSQTCLDVVFDLVAAGEDQLAATLLEGLQAQGRASSMALYALAWLYDRLGAGGPASEARRLAGVIKPVDTFPYRLPEIEILRAATESNGSDAQAANLLGCILYDKKRYAEAAAAWERAIGAAPDFYMPYRNFAVAKYSYLGQRETALSLLKRAMELHPKDDFLLKEVNYVMARLGVDAQERLDYVLRNLPDKPSDHLTWDLADAFSNTLNFDRALETLANHEFVAAERCETYLTEAYTFACSAKGRLALREGNLSEALDWFRRGGQKIPANFRAGWWDTQALYYVRYYEALVLIELGRRPEAKPILERIIEFIRSEYSPYMGPEVDYYIACAHRLLGDEITARKHISSKVVDWEKELESDVDRKPPSTAVYISYIDDWAKTYKGAIEAALAYSRLFFWDTEGARAGFQRSLALAPDNVKAVFELSMIDQTVPPPPRNTPRHESVPPPRHRRSSSSHRYVIWATSGLAGFRLGQACGCVGIAAPQGPSSRNGLLGGNVIGRSNRIGGPLGYRRWCRSWQVKRSRLAGGKRAWAAGFGNRGGSAAS